MEVVLKVFAGGCNTSAETPFHGHGENNTCCFREEAVSVCVMNSIILRYASWRQNRITTD